MRLLVFIFACFLLLSACSGDKFKKQNIPSKVLLAEGVNLLGQGKTSKAIDIFQRVEINYADEDSAIVAQVFLIWIYYQQNNLDSAEAISRSFLRYYPYNKYSPWVEYMNAIITYEQIPNPKRDLTLASNALTAFNKIIQKYPNTEYAKDVQFKSALVKQILAERVMEIGRYYLRHKAYIGAMYRFQEIVKVYNDSVFVPEALYRLVFTAISLGINEEAINDYKVLKYNYPDNDWTKRAEKLLKKYKINVNKE
ncbi:outer membrane protein assembly factor BamD [Rickettsiales bacterium LUAb2]